MKVEFENKINYFLRFASDIPLFVRPMVVDRFSILVLY